MFFNVIFLFFSFLFFKHSPPLLLLLLLLLLLFLLYIIIIIPLIYYYYLAIHSYPCMHYFLPQTSPHVINAVMEAIGGMRVSLGAHRVLQYTLQGLFHPARKVREVYWKIYNALYIGSQVGNTVIRGRCHCWECYWSDSKLYLFIYCFAIPSLRSRRSLFVVLDWQGTNIVAFLRVQDALVAAFPAIPDDSTNTYRRTMLETLL